MNDYTWKTGISNDLPKIHITINYGTERAYGFKILYTCSKTFEFVYNPTMPCTIILKNDAIKSFDFKDIYFDPSINTYMIVNNREIFSLREEQDKITEIDRKRFIEHNWLVVENNKIMER